MYGYDKISHDIKKTVIYWQYIFNNCLSIHATVCSSRRCTFACSYMKPHPKYLSHFLTAKEDAIIVHKISVSGTSITVEAAISPNKYGAILSSTSNINGDPKARVSNPTLLNLL